MSNVVDFNLYANKHNEIINSLNNIFDDVNTDFIKIQSNEIVKDLIDTNYKDLYSRFVEIKNKVKNSNNWISDDELEEFLKYFNKIIPDLCDINSVFKELEFIYLVDITNGEFLKNDI